MICVDTIIYQLFAQITPK